MRDHDTVRGMLEERLARLLSRVGHIEGDLRSERTAATERVRAAAGRWTQDGWPRFRPR